MKIIRSPEQMQRFVLAWRRKGKTIGFVPTMGALHAGHLSLIRRAARENKMVVVSIFVNPAQFGPKEDLNKYPRPFARDKKLCAAAGADVIFYPSPKDMYPPEFQTWVDVEKLSQPMEGQSRPGHFRGVATVVAKLLNIVQPTRAYFGQKDFQQMRVIQRMVDDLNMPFEIVPCPTVREPGGLAMSSRNAYLSTTEKRAAEGISLALRAAAELLKFPFSAASRRALVAASRILRRIPGGRLEYIEARDADTLQPFTRTSRRAVVAVALRLGPARLIDNILVSRKR